MVRFLKLSSNIKLYFERNKNAKTLVFVFLLITGLFLLTNTNNNPNIIIQRILRPVQLGNGTLYYAALIPAVMIYFSLKGIYRLQNVPVLRTRWRRLLVLMILLYLLPGISQGGIKIYKSFCNDLNAVYCHYDKMNISDTLSNSSRQITCKLTLENCSSKNKEFFVKIKVPDMFEEGNPPVLVNSGKLFLHPDEKREFTVTKDMGFVKTGDNILTSRLGFGFEFILYDSSREVRFAKKE